MQRFSGATYETTISKTLTEGIRTLSKRQGVTSFMTMLAGFKGLLHFLTGQHDIVLGTDMANRTNVQTEALIGFFVNLLVLRTDLSGNPSFGELLAREREVAIGAYAHQDLPFGKLVEELRPERNLSHSPLVQVIFNFEAAARQTAEMPGLAATTLNHENQAAKFDLTLYARQRCEEAFGQLVARHIDLVYSTALRQVRDVHLAQDVTQDVFILLARRCRSMDERIVLPVWLYKAACLESRNAIKSSACARNSRA